MKKGWVTSEYSIGISSLLDYIEVLRISVCQTNKVRTSRFFFIFKHIFRILRNFKFKNLLIVVMFILDLTKLMVKLWLILFILLKKNKKSCAFRESWSLSKIFYAISRSLGIFMQKIEILTIRKQKYFSTSYLEDCNLWRKDKWTTFSKIDNGLGINVFRIENFRYSEFTEIVWNFHFTHKI